MSNEPSRSGPQPAENFEGGCLCGAVRYRVAGPLDSVVHSPS